MDQAPKAGGERLGPVGRGAVGGNQLQAFRQRHQGGDQLAPQGRLAHPGGDDERNAILSRCLEQFEHYGFTFKFSIYRHWARAVRLWGGLRGTISEMLLDQRRDLLLMAGRGDLDVQSGAVEQVDSVHPLREVARQPTHIRPGDPAGIGDASEGGRQLPQEEVAAGHGDLLGLLAGLGHQAGAEFLRLQPREDQAGAGEGGCQQDRAETHSPPGGAGQADAPGGTGRAVRFPIAAGVRHGRDCSPPELD